MCVCPTLQQPCNYDRKLCRSAEQQSAVGRLASSLPMQTPAPRHITSSCRGGVGGGGATCCQCVHGKQKRKVGERESTTGWNTRWDGWEAAAATVSIPERKPRAVGGRRQLDSPLAETSRGQQRKQQLLRRAITAGPLTSIPIGPRGLWDGNKKKIHNIESGLTTHKNLLL